MDRVNATGELEALPADLAAAGTTGVNVTPLLPLGRVRWTFRRGESAGRGYVGDNLRSIDDYTCHRMLRDERAMGALGHDSTRFDHVKTGLSVLIT